MSRWLHADAGRSILHLAKMTSGWRQQISTSMVQRPRLSARLCDEENFITDEHKESTRALSEAARRAGDLLHEVAAKKRFKPKKAWAGPGMTWVIQYDKKKDCVTNYIIMEEFKGDQIVVAMASEGEFSVEEVESENDFEGHQWFMDRG